MVFLAVGVLLAAIVGVGVLLDEPTAEEEPRPRKTDADRSMAVAPDDVLRSPPRTAAEEAPVAERDALTVRVEPTISERSQARRKRAPTQHVVIEVDDDRRSPLPEAFALLRGLDDPLPANDAGEIVLLADAVAKSGANVLVGAPGFLYETVRGVRPRRGLALARERPQRCQLLWEDTREPVAGATLTRLHGPYLADWIVQALYREGNRHLTTDATGYVEVPILMLDGWMQSMEVLHPECGRYLLRLERFVDLQDLTNEVSRRGPPREVLIPRDARRAIVQFRDARGHTLPGRTVRLRPRSDHWFVETTDDDGRIVVRYHGERNRWYRDQRYACAVELGDGRWWVQYLKIEDDDEDVPLYTVYCGFRDVVVRTDHPESEDFAVATAPGRSDTAYGEGRFGTYVVEPPVSGSLAWRKLGRDGRTTLRAGHQGESTLVLVRHEPTGLIVHWTLLRGETDVTVDPGGLCDLTIHLEGKAPAKGSVWLSPCTSRGIPLGGTAPAVSLSDLPATVRLPRGFYDATMSNEEREFPRVVDARGATAELALPPPPRPDDMIEFRGEVTGSLGGPIGGAELSVRFLETKAGFGTVTARDGSFSGRIAANLISSMTVHVKWPDGYPGQTYEPQVLAFDPRVRYFSIERAEARLVLHQDRDDPLAGHFPTRIFADHHHVPGQFSLWLTVLLAPGETRSLLGPPATYHVEQGEGAALFHEKIFIPRDREARVVIRHVEAGVLLLGVRWPGDQGAFTVSLQSQEDGSDTVLWTANPVSSHAYLPRPFLVTPGFYDLRLHGTLPDPSYEESFPVSWESLVEVRPGKVREMEIPIEGW